MKKLFFTFFILSLCIFGSDLLAQGLPPNPGGGVETKPECYPPPCIPIDGGLSWLLLAGTIYGSKKILNKKKEENV